MNNQDRIDALVRLVDALGADAADLAAVATRVGTADAMETAKVPTVAEYLPKAKRSATPQCDRTYRAGWKRFEAEFGDRRLDDVSTRELIDLRDRVHRDVGAAVVERAKQSGKPLRSYEPQAHGYGAAENFVRAVRFVYTHANQTGAITVNPAKDVKIPPRPDAPERPLDAEELAEVATVWCTTGNDTALDSLLYEFHRKTAARRIGGLNLRLANLDRREGSLWLTEKFSKVRQQPLDVDLLDRLERFARSRGAVADHDHVFRLRSGTPISYKRYEGIYGRLHRHTTWTRQLEVGVHWIRHTTLDDVTRIAGPRVAAAYAGHSNRSMGTIGQYTKVPFETLAEVYEELFGPRFRTTNE